MCIKGSWLWVLPFARYIDNFVPLHHLGPPEASLVNVGCMRILFWAESNIVCTFRCQWSGCCWPPVWARHAVLATTRQPTFVCCFPKFSGYVWFWQAVSNLQLILDPPSAYTLDYSQWCSTYPPELGTLSIALGCQLPLPADKMYSPLLGSSSCGTAALMGLKQDSLLVGAMCCAGRHCHHKCVFSLDDRYYIQGAPLAEFYHPWAKLCISLLW